MATLTGRRSVGGTFALVGDDEFTRSAGAIALGVLPILGVGHLVEYLMVWLLAREGQMAIARVEPLGGEHAALLRRRSQGAMGLSSILISRRQRASEQPGRGCAER
jgi:hypothetical protein